jgi:uncharacterized protein (DUF488 family)
MIFTIGYGNRTIEAFLDLLRQYHIDYLVDVRSAPYSKYNPDFSKKALAQHLKANEIGYIFMGEQLGGKPEDAACYTPDGKIDYERVKQTDFYQRGIKRLQLALEKQYRVVLMCSELKPEMCHRSKLIGQTLAAANIPVQHIDEAGELHDQPAVILRLTQGQLSFLAQTFTSTKKYAPLPDEEAGNDT